MRRVCTVLATLGLVAPAACDKFGGGDSPADPSAQPEGKGDAKSKAGTPAAGGGSADTPVGEGDDGEPAASGPAVAWSLALTSVPRSVIVTDAGTVLTVSEDAIRGYVDGKEAWAKQGAYSNFSRLQDGSVVTTTGATIFAVDSATGADRFKVDVPAPPDWETEDRKGNPIPPPGVVASAAFGSQLLIADQEARFFVVDPPTCAKQEQACLRPAGALEDEELEVGTRLSVGADGTRYLIEEDTMRVFDQALETIFELESPGRIVSVAPSGPGGIALAANGKVALLQMPKCLGTLLKIPRVALGSKHCFRWIYGDDLDDAAPAVVDPQTLAANGKKRLQAITEGDDTWKVPIDSMGPVFAGKDGLLYTLAVTEGEAGSQVSVKAVNGQRGTVAWSVSLPFQTAAPAAVAEGEAVAEVVVPENLALDARGDYIVASLDQNVALLKIP